MTIAGVAWAPHTGIERVEVKVDDGAWVDAELARVPSVDTWVQWKVTVDLDSGRHRATVRATDRSGETQTSESAAPAPNGASGWHSVSFEAT